MSARVILSNAPRRRLNPINNPTRKPSFLKGLACKGGDLKQSNVWTSALASLFISIGFSSSLIKKERNVEVVFTKIQESFPVASVY